MHRSVCAALITLSASAGMSYAQPDPATDRPVSIPAATIPMTAFFGLTPGTAIATPGGRIELAPTISKSINAVNARVIRGGLVGRTGRFVLAEVEGRIAGAIWTNQAAYEIRPADGFGGVTVTTINHADLPGCATLGRALPEVAVPFILPGSTLRGEAEQIVRVFVGITRAGEVQMGGAAAAIAVAAAAVESANSAYENSEMTVGDAGVVQCQLELVGTFTVDPGPGLGAGGLLGALRSQSDGIMDELHILRDASGADLVSLLSESGIGACGIAYLDPDNASNGFSVTAQSCAVGNLSFAHELGHNQGAHHDADNAGNGYAPYGFGWRWTTTGGSFRRSVMAYSPGSRRLNFSNPGVLNGGTPTGHAQQADNARLIGETFLSVASFRTGTGTGVGDCDANGTPDLIEILDNPTLDSDISGTLDTCDVMNGLLEDCNKDGFADIGQIRPRIDLDPEAISLANFPPFETGIADAFEAFSNVEITLAADADLGAPNEYLDVFINGISQGRFWDVDGGDCSPAITTTVITLTAAQWNSFGPDVTVSIQKPNTVGATCPSDSISVNIAYTGIDRDFDANGDGVLDACSPACNAADIAEPFGTLDLADISGFITAFTTQNPAGDLSGDGVFDLADITAFVTAFNGGCP